MPYWFMIAVFIVPGFIVFMWEFWLGSIKPDLIPSSEITAKADALILQYGTHAAEIAYGKEERAWRYGRTFERAKWRRIRHQIIN